MEWKILLVLVVVAALAQAIPRPQDDEEEEDAGEVFILFSKNSLQITEKTTYGTISNHWLMFEKLYRTVEILGNLFYSCFFQSNTKIAVPSTTNSRTSVPSTTNSRTFVPSTTNSRTSVPSNTNSNFQNICS